ncbi:MAG: porphobilinogen synthase [Actinomycetaceae bacterium]|nr:porphobilinogen synthase [Actinomycetaceae bacterium]MDU0969985.1 porphobilinogen synthase [Actinomycetaceae bacterium]
MTIRPLSDTEVPTLRPRRGRTFPAMRDLVAETHVHRSQLILPVFVADGLTEPRPISSLPGVVQHSLDSLAREAERVADAGIGGIMLFGVPTDADKDECGSAAWDPNGILNRGIAAVVDAVGTDTVVMADTCLDEFTSHGHCGVLSDDGAVDNDATLPLYAAMALSQARAGAHIVAPSGMMDGQVRVIRGALDAEGFTDVAIMAYSAKYASGFFGPFREAVGCSLVGDRRAYQQDPRNRREGIREAMLDIDEGADFVMVKPAGYYLDVLAEVAQISPVPVCAYQVSGEYAMLEAAAANGWLDRERVIDESLASIVRAGADQVLTYYALEAAARLGA